MQQSKHKRKSQGTPGLQANVHRLPTKEGIPHSTNTNALAEAVVQPPKLVEHLVPVQVRGDVGLRDVRHAVCLGNWDTGRTTPLH